MQSTSWQRLVLPIMLLVVSLSPAYEAATGTAAMAQQPPPASPVSPSFHPIGLYALEVDGKPVSDAKFFHSQASGSILIETSQLSAMIELQPRGRVLLTHSTDAFHRNRNGTIDRMPRAKPVTSSSFTLVDSLPRFEIDGKRVAVRQKPPLLGPQTAESLIQYDPSYGIRSKLYQPQEQYMNVLRQVTKPVLVRVFLGTWCSVCSELVPHVLRVDEGLRDTNVRFEYYGIPQDYQDAEVKRLAVSNVPTGIVYLDGEEVQRIVGYSWRFPDLSLHNLLVPLAR
ncbi:MAG TPA: thioredoxin family protein [Thermoanaerobaculia bacterium]|nr:thioredoxin family protein [Thermoanaerobaculia bacterium]